MWWLAASETSMPSAETAMTNQRMNAEIELCAWPLSNLKCTSARKRATVPLGSTASWIQDCRSAELVTILTSDCLELSFKSAPERYSSPIRRISRPLER